MHVFTETWINGVPLRYRRAGRGRPLIALHGWGGSSRYWIGTLAHLSAQAAIYAPDLPGYGDSPASGAATPDAVVETIIAFANAMGIERFDLNGHSFAANIAVRLAARFPERVDRLILTCLSTFRNERERQIVDQIHHLLGVWLILRRPWMEQRRSLMRLISRRFFYSLPNDEAMMRMCFRDFLKMDRATAIASAASAGARDFPMMLASVQAPTLLVVARNDGIMPPNGAPVVAEQIAGCRTVWIERCGHLPMLERPSEYHQILGDFLAAPHAGGRG